MAPITQIIEVPFTIGGKMRVRVKSDHPSNIPLDVLSDYLGDNLDGALEDALTRACPTMDDATIKAEWEDAEDGARHAVDMLISVERLDEVNADIDSDAEKLNELSREEAGL